MNDKLMNYTVLARASKKEPWGLLNIVERANGDKEALASAQRLANGWRQIFNNDTIIVALTYADRCKPDRNTGFRDAVAVR